MRVGWVGRGWGGVGRGRDLGQVGAGGVRMVCWWGVYARRVGFGRVCVLLVCFLLVSTCGMHFLLRRTQRRHGSPSHADLALWHSLHAHFLTFFEPEIGREGFYFEPRFFLKARKASISSQGSISRHGLRLFRPCGTRCTPTSCPSSSLKRTK